MMSQPTTTEESPARPVPPPTKKQRSGTPSTHAAFRGGGNRDRISDATEDAIARRRAELRRLQQLRAPTAGATSTAAVLAMARSQLGGGGPPPSVSTNTSATNSQGPSNNNSSRPNVPRQNVARVRNSDIFPNAPKLVDSPSVQPARVARTLEFASPTSPESPRFLAPTASSRAKSAPPMRPPPPPGRTPPAAAEAPPAVADRSDRPPPTPFHPKRGGMTAKSPEKRTDRTKAERPPPTPFYPKKEVDETKDESVQEADAEPDETKPDEVKSMPQKSPPISIKNAVPGEAVAKKPVVSNGFGNSSSGEKESMPELVDEQPDTNETENEPHEPVKSPTQPIEAEKASSAEPIKRSPTTPRRDLLQNLRQFADSPSSPQHEEKKEASNGKAAAANDVRLVQELRNATDAKAEALRKVAALELEIKRWVESKRNSSSASLEKLLQIAETKGDAAALGWAREQLGLPAPMHSFSQVGFLSPVNGATPSPGRGMGALSPLAAGHHPVRRRVATPHPKRRYSLEENDETQEVQEFLLEATKSVPFEYTSTLATYVVRCPYSDNLNNDGLWETSGVAPKDVYSSTANAGQPASLEILAQILSDGSLFTLSGAATVRHKLRHGDGGWRVFENVDEMDKPLGCVMYIDEHANEKEYWLDTIYDEALAAREAYCSSLISTASALQASKENGGKPNTVQPVTVQSETLHTTTITVEKSRPQTVDACVGTDDMPVGPVASAAQPTAPSQPAEKQIPSEAKPPPSVEEDDASSDVLSAMMAMLFSTIFWFIWLIFVRIPLKMFKLSVFAAVVVAILSAVWLLVADDHGAHELGAKLDLAFNPRTF